MLMTIHNTHSITSSRIHAALTFAAFILSCLSALSQTVVKGKVTAAEDGSAISLANVRLLRVADSTFVSSCLTDSVGHFSFELSSGKAEDYLIHTLRMGYRQAIEPVSSNMKEQSIVLPSEFGQLSPAEVVYVHPSTQFEGDALVTQVKGTILERLGRATDVLPLLPGLVDNGGQIEVVGRGAPAFYINGRPMHSLQELEQISSDAIVRVEVVTSPGARYSSETSSVVRIITAKPQGEGFSVENLSKIGWKDYALTSDLLHLNYRKGKLDVFADFNYDYSHQKSRNLYDQTTWSETVKRQQIDMRGKNHKQLFEGKAGFDFSPSANHSLGMFYEVQRTPKHGHGTYNGILLQEGLPQDSLVSAQLRRGTETTHLLEGYYTGNAGRWNFDANFSLMQKDGLERNASQERTKSGSVREVCSVDDSQGQMAAFEANAARTLGKAAKLSFGTAGTLSSRRDAFQNPDGTLGSSHQKVNEGNAALYAEWGQAIGRCQVRLGLRYEHTDSRYYENHVKKAEQSRTYDKLLPSAMLVAPLGKSQIQLSYARQYQRPLYTQLSDQLYYVNRSLYESGNSHLRSVIVDNLSVNYRIGWFMLMGQYMRHDGRIITRARAYEGDPHITLLQKVNSETAIHQYNVMASFAPRFKKYTPMLLAGVIGQRYSVAHRGEVLHLNNPMLMVRFNNIYAFSPTTYVRADFNYMSEGESENIRLKSYWGLSLSASKMFGPHWMVQVAANDLFNASRNRKFTMLDTRQAVHITKCQNTRSALLTVRYRFNTTPSKYKGKGTGQEERKRF